MKKQKVIPLMFTIAWTCLYVCTPSLQAETKQAPTDGEDAMVGGGAAASDPTAAVSYQDLRVRWLDLGGSSERLRYTTEGGMMLTPNLKITNELNYYHTDISGDDKGHLESFRMKGIHLSPIKIGEIKGRFAWGVEWIENLGDFSDGTGTGTNQIAPLIGVGLNMTPNDFLIPLVQYFHSYETDRGAPDVSQTGPRLIWIHKFPEFQGWGKIDYKMLIDHEDADKVSHTMEFQLGKMFTPKIGAYVDALVGIDDHRPYDWGLGTGIRFMY